MHPFLRILAIGGVFVGAVIAYAVLGGVTLSRSSDGERSTSHAVSTLWGAPLAQRAPRLSLVRYENRTTTQQVERDGRNVDVERVERVRVLDPVSPMRSRITADVNLDTRRRGLVFYALYGVRFEGRYRYQHEASTDGVLHVDFTFPDAYGLYDDFVVEVDGVARAEAQRPTSGGVSFELPVRAGRAVNIRVAYRSRGRESFAYLAGEGVESLRDFDLRMRTDFHDIDFDADSLSPTARRREARGELCTWHFTHVVTGRRFAIRMPEPLQPGEFAAGLSFSAPVALFLYFIVLEVLARRAKSPFHPLHYLFIAAAFFSFHLLFAYTADRLPIEGAFSISAATSLFLVTSYVAVVVGPRFAFGPSALAQLVYLVGFSLAHFARGSTGLTVTVLSILTLFLVMQWSAREERKARLSPADA